MSLAPPPTPRRSVATIARTLVRGMAARGTIDSARLMAFDFFLSLVPLLVLLGFVMGRLVRKRGVEALVGPLLETIPDAAADLARHELERLAGASAGTIAPLGAVTFLWLTSSGIHQMMDVFEVATGAPRRRWLKQRFIALVTVVLGVALVSGTAWALVAGDDRLHKGDESDSAPGAPAPSAATTASAVPSSPSPPHPPAAAARPKHEATAVVRTKKHRLLNRVHSPWERVVAGGALLAVGVLGLAWFYRFAVEHPPGVRRRAWPGAIVAMGVWLLVSWLFGSYIGSLGAYAVYYGSLAAVAVLLVWLFLTSLALLLGAELNALLEGVRAHEG